MIYIGNHLSASKGFLAMGKKALELGGDTFAFFTRNPRGGAAREIDAKDADALRELMEEHHFGKLVAHAPYTMNVCAAKDRVREFSLEVFADDLERMEYLPGNYYNFHPGAHVGQGSEKAVEMIADAINQTLKEKHQTTVLLETMAGKGTEMGRSFEELRAILERVELPEKVGVCFDTCHTWDGGYDLSDLDAVLEEFDRIIGLEKLLAVHLNDSKNLCGAHKDRHEKLGKGKIGEEILKSVVLHPLLQGKPFILETPNEDAGYKWEIATVKSWVYGTVSPQRHKNMSRIHSKDTGIEVALRKALWHKGIRYRKNVKGLPGTPDIVITKYKLAVFCDSEFFHGKDWKVLKPRLEKGANSAYWIEKIQRNMKRDIEKDKELLFMGWTVIHFWGKEILSDADKCVSVIEETIFDIKLGR